MAAAQPTASEVNLAAAIRALESAQFQVGIARRAVEHADEDGHTLEYIARDLDRELLLLRSNVRT